MASGLLSVGENLFSTGISIADGTGEIASVCYFYQRETAMLFVVGAKSAIVGTAIFYRGIEFKWHVPWFDKFQGLFVILNVIGNQHFLMSMSGTVLHQVNAIVPKNDFCFYLDQAMGTNTVG
jgi:hypothetical protein